MPDNSSSEASGISGNASPEIKRSLGDIDALFNARFKPSVPLFAEAIQSRLKTTEISIKQKDDEPKKLEAKVVVETVVTEGQKTTTCPA